MLANLKLLTLSLLRSSVEKLMYGLDGQTVNWAENWLNGQAQRVVLSGTEAGWRPVTCRAVHGTILGPVLLNMLISEQDDGAECTSSKSADAIKMAELCRVVLPPQSSIKKQEKLTEAKLMKVTKRK